MSEVSTRNVVPASPSVSWSHPDCGRQVAAMPLARNPVTRVRRSSRNPRVTHAPVSASDGSCDSVTSVSPIAVVRLAACTRQLVGGSPGAMNQPAAAVIVALPVVPSAMPIWTPSPRRSVFFVG